MTSQCHKWHHSVTSDTTMSQMTSQFHRWDHSVTNDTTVSQMASQCHKWHHCDTHEDTVSPMTSQCYKWHHSITKDITISQTAIMTTKRTRRVFQITGHAIQSMMTCLMLSMTMMVTMMTKETGRAWCIFQITDHTAQSMMTRYRDVIVPNLDCYNIPDYWKSSLTGNLALAAHTPLPDAGWFLSVPLVIPPSFPLSLLVWLSTLVIYRDFRKWKVVRWEHWVVFCCCCGVFLGGGGRGGGGGGGGGGGSLHWELSMVS